MAESKIGFAAIRDDGENVHLLAGDGEKHVLVEMSLTQLLALAADALNVAHAVEKRRGRK